MRTLLLIFFFIPTLMVAQFEDDFSDGNFTDNPTWQGEDEHFEIDGSSRLHLLAPSETSTSYLSTSSEAINDASWEFTVEFDFNPTSSNMAQVYLVANSPDLEADLQGYFVRIGNTSKEVSLYRQDGFGDVDEIIDGAEDILDMDPVNCRIRVTRSADGNWELFRDNLGGQNFTSEGTVVDQTYESSLYFGVFCKYTSTRSDKFYYSNFVVTGSGFVDEVPPTLLSHELLNQNQVSLEFSEPMDQTSLEALGNYTANNGIGNPSSINITGVQSANLTFDETFVDGQINTLSLSNLTDLSGNILNTVFDFTYYEIGIPTPGDLIINEIMADPTPVVGLPEAEYLELFNTSEMSFDLSDIVLYNSSTQLELTGVIPAGGYLIVAHEEDENLFVGLGTTLGISPFTALANTGDSLTLTLSTGEILDVVSYDDDWYQNSLQSDGGYSLERINPFLSCSSAFNWIASSDVSGGTPGAINAVYDEAPDLTPPTFVEVLVIDEQTLHLVFDKPLLSSDVINAEFFLDNGIDISSVLLLPGSIVSLSLTQELIGSTLYTIIVNDLVDCSGNALLDGNVMSFGLPEDIEVGDIIINEILSNPRPDGVDFIEIFNLTDKFLSLRNCKLSKYDDGELQDFEIITSVNKLVAPNEYIVLTEDAENILEEYPDTDVSKILEIVDLPSMNDTEGNIVFLNHLNQFLDEVFYTDDLYQNSSFGDGGNTLERKNPFLICSGDFNWIGSSDPSGGTPGKINSAFDELPDLIAPIFDEILVIDEQTLQLEFDKPMLAIDVADASFLIDNNVTITDIELTSSTIVEVSLDQNLQLSTLYTITVNNLQDCSGNFLEDGSGKSFGLPEPIGVGDIVINEILSDPRPGGSDFIEIYNVSDKFISLNNCKLTRYVDGELEEAKIITTLNKQVLPNGYVVITEDAFNISEEYSSTVENNVLEIEDLPSLNDSEGNIIFINNSNEIIDEVTYSDSYHFELLDITEGVSLERLSFSGPSSDPDNWHSAAETVGFATPGYQNSQTLEFGEQEQNYTIQPRVISPDNDGFEDVMAIHYVMDSPDFVANITILDAQGRIVKYLTKNRLLGSEGTIYWDGLLEEESKAPIGLYVIYIESFDLDGNVEMIKEVVTVAGNL